MYNTLHILYFFLFFFVLSHFIFKLQNVNWLGRSHSNFKKKTEKDDHLIPFGRTLSREEVLVQRNFWHLVSFVVVCGNAVKFQDLRSILRIIVKRHLQRLSENI